MYELLRGRLGGKPMNTPASPVQPDEIDAWRSYIGHQEVRRQVLDVASLQRFALAIGASPDVERVLPPLAHWAYFLDSVPTDLLGIDGHPARGSGLYPPIRKPRRMFAASSIRFIEPIRLGQEAELTLSLVDVKHRTGKSGDLVLLEVDRRLRQDGRECVAETQTLVYRDLSDPMTPVEDTNRAAGPDEVAWTPGPIDLFRFSAVTFNAHRVHYDFRYARDQEGYPDLLVHGPLTATKLFAFARERSSRPLVSFRFRALGPLFVNQRALIAPGTEVGQVDCIRCDGTVVMSANAAGSGEPS